MVAADKYRLNLLRKRLEEIEKKRIESNQEKYSPGEISITKPEQQRIPAENRKPYFLETLEKLSQEQSIADEKRRQKMCDDYDDEYEDYQHRDRVSPVMQVSPKVMRCS